MEFVENSVFNDYVDKYKNLPLHEKKELVEKELEELIAALNALNEKNGKHVKTLFNREILDLKKSDATEDDFVEAVFVYTNAIKELIADLVAQDK